ncbi:DNA polymerase/3'-5' exonuclease PolX [Candidatus Uhrbacteria bacterium]|nr:DNA polymerase/3'-5' exonuclease PolX [Candidatus Uhrbacteria bacterium]
MAKQMNNRRIVEILREIALYLRAQDVAFKPQAYEVAAEGIAGMETELSTLYKAYGKKCLDDIPGVGASIAETIEELVTTGNTRAYQVLKKKYPFDMLAFSRIPEVGPKTALLLYKKLHVKTLRDLERAGSAHKIENVPGLGHKSEQKILRGIAFLKSSGERRIIHDVLPFAQHMVENLRRVEGVTHVDLAGSLRRRKETIGDIDLIATTRKPKELIRAFKSLPEVVRVLKAGPQKLAVRFSLGLGGDLLVLDPNAYGTGLVHFTGSREHNILLRELAQKKHLKLSEHGLFRGKTRLAIRTEEQLYRALGLQWIPPELRVGGDEIGLARQKKIPALIPYGSLQGDLQVQTDWTDGTASIEDMARAAKALGLSYMGVTDHTKALTMTGGLDERRLIQQGKEIDRVNKKLRGLRVLKSTECDILKDGSLDLHDTALKTLDLVCVSIHSHFALPKREMTERIIRALKHPLVNIFLHPTGRVVGRREPYQVEMDRVIRAAREYGVVLEINGSERLDLHEEYIRQCVDAGTKLVINSDAHDPRHFSHLDHGIAQARKGWARKADVLNTRPLKAFMVALKKNRV